MLPRRGILRQASPLGGIARTVIQGSSRAPRSLSIERAAGARQFGTNQRRGDSVLRKIAGSNNALSGRRIGGGSAAFPAVLPIILSRQTRYASTQQQPNTLLSSSSSSSSAATTNPETVAPISPPSNSSEWPITDLTNNLDLTTSDLFNAPEQIGWLRGLGLEYGWGPTSTMQWILEHVYIYTGLPWWASLGVVAVLIRAFMFVPALQANDTTQRMQDLRKDVRYSLAQEKLRNAVMNTRDQHAMMTAQREVRMIERANGVRQWKLFVPLIQVPITIGAFRLLRGMAALPVPSLESGGLWWFSDLTVADPYFALPILSSAFLYGIMRMGLPYMAPQQRRMMQIMSVALIPVGGIVTLYMPAAVQVFFVFTGLLQYLQTWAFYQPWVRRFFGLGPVFKFDAPRIPSGGSGASASASASGPAPPPGGSYQAPRVIGQEQQQQAPASDDGLFGTVKSSVSWVREKMAETSAKSENKVAATKAQEYEQRRALQEQDEWRARVQEKRERKRRD